MTSPGKLSGKRVILLPLTEKSRRRPPQIMQGQGKFGFICPDKIFRATGGTTPVQMGCLVATRPVEGPSLITSHSPCVLLITSLGRVKGFVACRSCLASPFCQEVVPRPLQISKERKARGFFCKWSWKAHGSFHKQASLPSKQDPQTSTSGLGGNGGWRLVVKDGEAAKRWDPGIFSWKPVWCQGSLHQQPKEGA